jgi:hypothetical protein
MPRAFSARVNSSPSKRSQPDVDASMAGRGVQASGSSTQRDIPGRGVRAAWRAGLPRDTLMVAATLGDLDAPFHSSIDYGSGDSAERRFRRFDRGRRTSVMKLCGDQWKAAKAAGTTNGETWPQFLAQCRAGLNSGGAAAAPAPAQTGSLFPWQQPAAPAPSPPPSTATPGNGQSVMKQCGAQWQAAKAAGTTNRQTWPQFLKQCRSLLASTTSVPPSGGFAPAAPPPAPAPQTGSFFPWQQPAAPAPAPAPANYGGPGRPHRPNRWRFAARGRSLGSRSV